MKTSLRQKIIKKKAKIGIIGLGYVGLPLAIEFSKVGFEVVGIDKDKDRINRLKKRQSYITDIDSDELKKVNVKATDNFSVLKSVDVIIICVPTPLRKTKDPDISFIVDAVSKIAQYLRAGQLIILESTTYPGTTEELILSRLNETGKRAGKDFFLVFSPERIDPGNKEFRLRNIPKVVGGIDKESTELAKLLYEKIITEVIKVSSSKVAEMVKLLENTFRIVNIGLINEIALLCNKIGIDVWEVIEAAKSKPFGFMPFYPGPGLGGHCIPTDPLYLSWKAKEYGFEARFIELASQINSYMPGFVVEKIVSALNSQNKPLKNSKVFVIGVTYKADVKDLRESPSLEIIEKLKKDGAKISYFDPLIPYLRIDDLDMKSKILSAKTLKDADCVVIVTPHSSIDYRAILQNSRLIVDTRNVFKAPNKKVIKL